MIYQSLHFVHKVLCSSKICTVYFYPHLNNILNSRANTSMCHLPAQFSKFRFACQIPQSRLAVVNKSVEVVNIAPYVCTKINNC